MTNERVQGLQQKLNKATNAQAILKEENLCLKNELYGMKLLMAGSTESITQLQLEKGKLEDASLRQHAKLEAGLLEKQQLQTALCARDAAKDAIQVQLNSVQERGMLLERQLGMKAADWEVACEQLTQARKDAAQHRAAEEQLKQDLDR